MNPKPRETDYTCPLAAVDRRLEDAHRQWHQAEQGYFDPEEFRLAIQGAIQTLRTVTFVLQKHKDKIPEFETWYGDVDRKKPGRWQKRLADDPLMRWMVDARNRIEKQGDLEAHSFIRAEIVASHLNEGPVIELPARLFDQPRQLIKNIPEGAVGEHVRKNGILRIQRRWVENTLPEYELLDAVAVAYGRISELVHDAHRQLGLECPLTINVETGQPFARGGQMPCMIGHADARTLNINLADGAPIELEIKQTGCSPRAAEVARERYGDIIHEGMFGPPNAQEEEIVASLFETARKMFLKDGYHLSIFFLFRDRKLVHLVNLRPEDQAQKYLMMRTLAHEVTKHGADAIIALGEVWIAPADALSPYQRPIDSAAREEALTALLVTKSGNPIQLSAIIQREAGELTLAKTEHDFSPAVFSFAPVYGVWGRAIPEEWLKASEEMIKGKPSKPKA